MSKLFKLSIISLLVVSFGLSLNNKAITAKINKQKVTTGEVFTYSLKIEGTFKDPVLKLPDFENFKVISQSQSQSYRQTKEGTENILSLIYHLFAPEPGVFTIRPATLENESTKYKSNSVTIKVKGKFLEKKKKIRPYTEKGTDI